ncbi:MAG: GNAT family N-acetyltransferase [Thermoplasmata archaeon]|nr:GNAT family N-acetyltransferase [Thermoplasmata archaeon]
MTATRELRELYDREMRKDPAAYAGARIEPLGRIVRVVGEENYVIFSDLGGTDAARVVHEQADHFRRAGAEVEWKVFGHDLPENLESLLAAEGFVPDELETLVVLELPASSRAEPRPPGLEVRRVTDEAGLRDAATVNAAAFGPGGRPFVERWAAWIRDPTQGLFVAYLDGAPVASGRLEMPAGRSFAGLYGGGTAPAFRHRGIYRTLVAARADVARERGYRFLTVDARETSRPILERLGFVPLTTTRPWVLRPGADPRSPNAGTTIRR